MSHPPEHPPGYAAKLQQLADDADHAALLLSELVARATILEELPPWGVEPATTSLPAWARQLRARAQHPEADRSP